MGRMDKGQIAVLIFLVIFLAVTIVWGVSAWNASSDVPMSKHGWIALGLGTFFSLLIGCGLMALMFFSSRSGHDEQADPFRKPQPPEE
jgi:flagellar basal body-associated protein FliL